MAENGFRLRIRFMKIGRLAYLSHLEVMRACERAVRRARLPYAVTQGFSPRMKVAFGPALPVGTAGESEFFDLWLTAHVPAGPALEALAASSAPELAVTACRYVPAVLPSLSTSLTLARYDVVTTLPAARSADLDVTLKDVMSEGGLQVEHKGKTKSFDLAIAVAESPRVHTQDGRAAVSLAVRIGPEGSLRPESLVSAALEKLGDGEVLAIVRRAMLVEGAEGPADPMGAE